MPNPHGQKTPKSENKINQRDKHQNNKTQTRMTKNMTEMAKTAQC